MECDLFRIFPQSAQNEETYHCFCLCWFNEVKEMLLTLVRLCVLVAMSVILSENTWWKIITSEEWGKIVNTDTVEQRYKVYWEKFPNVDPKVEWVVKVILWDMDTQANLTDFSE